MDEVDVVIVGGGIAGSSAALTAARYGLRTVMLAPEGPMGALAAIEEIEGAPGLENVSGYDLCPTLHAQAVDAGAEVRPTGANEIERSGQAWVLTGDDGAIRSRAVIAATGTAAAHLGVPGEAEFVGRGVSHSASCDGPIFRGLDVVVVGGGDSTLQEALTLLANRVKVTIVQLEATFTAQDTYITRIAADRSCKVRYSSRILEILGAEKVSGVRVLDETTGTEELLSTSGVFAYVGRTPVSGWLRTLEVLDATGHVVVDAVMTSSEAGLFAAGDLRAGSPGQATSALGDGVSAATSAFHYLKSIA